MHSPSIQQHFALKRITYSMQPIHRLVQIKGSNTCDWYIAQIRERLYMLNISHPSVLGRCSLHLYLYKLTFFFPLWSSRSVSVHIPLLESRWLMTKGYDALSVLQGTRHLSVETWLLRCRNVFPSQTSKTFDRPNWTIALSDWWRFCGVGTRSGPSGRRWMG